MVTVSSASEFLDALGAASPGDEIVVTGGGYDFYNQFTIETDDVTVRAEQGSMPSFDFNDEGDGVVIRGHNVTFGGFEVSRSAWKGVNSKEADGVLIDGCDVHHCAAWGIMANGGEGVTFRNCDSHDHYSGGRDGDGFNMTGAASGGLIEGCRAWGTDADGFDMWVSNGHTIRNCVSWGHHDDGDGNAFKLGGQGEGGGHTVENCVAYDSRRGFDWNTGGDPITVRNCTSWDNEDENYRFRDNGDVLENNISYEGDVVVTGADERNNTWNLGIDDPGFRSLDPQSEHFLRLAEGSPCIGAGVDGGDLGAYPYTPDGTGDPPIESGLTGRHLVAGAAVAAVLYELHRRRS